MSTAEEIGTSSNQNRNRRGINNAKFKTDKISANEEDETISTIGAKSNRRRQNGRKMNFWVRTILGLAAIFIAVSSNVMSPAAMKWFNEQYDFPAATPHVSVESAITCIRFDPVTPFDNPITVYGWWVVHFNVSNLFPNHVLDYSNLVGMVYFEDSPLWVTMIPGFRHREGQQHLVNVTCAATQVRFRDSVKITNSNVAFSSGFSVRLECSIGQKESGKKYSQNVRSIKAICKMDVKLGDMVPEAKNGGVCQSLKGGAFKMSMVTVGDVCKVSMGNG